MLYFNSRDAMCKYPFGAVKVGESTVFKIKCDRQFSDAVLYLKKDGENEIRIPLKFENVDGAHCLLCAEYTFTRPGLYFYCFQFEGGRYGLYKDQSGNGNLSESGDWFIQFIYLQDFTTPSKFKGGVMYQIFPDRFFEGTKKETLSFPDRVYRANKDGLPFYGKDINTDYFGGDLKGIAEKLEYLKSLKVNCIYLNPVFRAHSNHRYNTADYMKIDPDLGDEEDFRRLCEKAHSMGISVILDGVFSHTGSDSIYFNREKRYGDGGAFNDPDSPYRRWYDFSEKYNCGYRAWWGFETLPEVNEGGESYIDFICGENGVIQYWLKAGADGIRLDVADELPDEFIRKIRRAVKRCGRDKLLIGEVWEDASTKISFGNRRRFLYGDELDSVMNYPFRNSVLDFIRNGNGEKFSQRIFSIYENYPKQALDCAWNSLSTHDTPRAITALCGENPDSADRNWQSRQKLEGRQLEKGKKMLLCAYALIFGLPGIPCIYYGDEIAMQGYRDPFNRGYFRWWDMDGYTLSGIQQLAQFRTSHPIYADGALHFVYVDFDCVAFVRFKDNSEALTAVNRGEREISFRYKGRTFCLPPISYINDDI